MSNRGRVNEFPRNVIGNQRLPLGRVIDKRLNVFLQQVRGVGRHIVLIEDSGSVVKSSSHRATLQLSEPAREGARLQPERDGRARRSHGSVASLVLSSDSPYQAPIRGGLPGVAKLLLQCLTATGQAIPNIAPDCVGVHKVSNRPRLDCGVREPTAEVALGALNETHALDLCEVMLMLLPCLRLAQPWCVPVPILLQVGDTLLNRPLFGARRI